jgi:uncharacterized protein with PIN domain
MKGPVTIEGYYACNCGRKWQTVFVVGCSAYEAKMARKSREESVCPDCQKKLEQKSKDQQENGI